MSEVKERGVESFWDDPEYGDLEPDEIEEGLEEGEDSFGFDDDEEGVGEDFGFDDLNIEDFGLNPEE